jgi:hypothetical protein
MFRCAWVALSCWALAPACAPASVRPNAPAPGRAVWEAPADLLPSDLDAAFRVDVTRLAMDLGAPLASDVIVDLVADRADEASAAWLGEAMSRAEVAWLGMRADTDLHAAEKVLIARGRFAGWQAPAPAGFRWVEPADGSRAHYLRAGAAAGAFERIHTVDDSLLVLATSAEMDPLRRFTAPTPGALRPPERGAVSAAARGPELRQMYLRAFPRLAERLAGAEHVAGYAEPRAANLDLDLEITFAAAEQAQGGSEVLLALFERLGEQPCAIGQAARVARVEAFERSVRIRAELAEPVVQGLKACAFTGECCGGARTD